MGYKFWTQQEEKDLIEGFQAGFSDIELAECLNRSAKAVLKKRIKLKLLRGANIPHWKDYEVKALKAGVRPRIRTDNAIRGKRHRLKIKELSNVKESDKKSTGNE